MNSPSPSLEQIFGDIQTFNFKDPYTEAVLPFDSDELLQFLRVYGFDVTDHVRTNTPIPHRRQGGYNFGNTDPLNWNVELDYSPVGSVAFSENLPYTLTLAPLRNRSTLPQPATEDKSVGDVSVTGLNYETLELFGNEYIVPKQSHGQANENYSSSGLLYVRHAKYVLYGFLHTTGSLHRLT